MRYCLRCVYPENARPAIYIDEQGICSGCRSFEARTIARAIMPWGALERDLGELLRLYAARQFAKGNPYDCIIPVSGGKDSHYQVWYVREKLGLNPLLVCFNHAMNTPLGVRNLTNLVEKTGCHLVRFTLAPATAMKLAVEMLKRIGDVTWHYHAGIMTYPIQVAVAYDVPLIVWGEEGFSELVGMHQPEDMVEFTRKKRMEHSMRGIEPEMLLDKFTRYELAPFFYPSDEKIERVGVRGIYLSNYLPWDARGQAEFAIERMGFETAQIRDRTFNLYAKTDCIHANGLHDYLKYLKFGYGRATDDASNEIRHGRMTREEGIDMVMKYDHVRPSDIAVFLHFAHMSPTEFDAIVAEYPKHDDNVGNHRNDQGVDQARVPPQTRAPFVRTLQRQSPRNEYPQQRYVTL
jgi:N-acetyl sugar amidotransferase